MTTHKFKVGDKVLSVRPKTSDERREGPGWVGEMDETLNKVGKITYVYNYNDASYDVIFLGVIHEYLFLEKWLKPVKKNVG